MEQAIRSFSSDLFFKWQIGCQQPDSSGCMGKGFRNLAKPLITWAPEIN